MSELGTREPGAEDILRYWFGELRDGWTAEDRSALWFGAKPAQDAEVARRFGDLIAAGGGSVSAADAEGALAAIIVLDQMTRMVHRGTAQAFASDRQALALCHQGLARGWDRQLAPVQRVFFYLPLSHSEALADQDRCVQLNRQMLEGAMPAAQARLRDTLAFAIKHQELIARFSRFPHRNAILGRPSTAEELAWLQESDERFGQRPKP